MPLGMMRSLSRRLDLQAKIFLVLVTVIVPTFLIVTIAENKITLPLMEEELRQVGMNSGKSLAAEIDRSRWLSLSNPTPLVENALQEILYTQPDIVRIDVYAKDPVGMPKLIASNVEEDNALIGQTMVLVETATSEFKRDDRGVGIWEIYVPIEHKFRDVRGTKKILGAVHLSVSTQLIHQIMNTLWKVTAGAAAFSVVSLILVLSYFLRKTIANDRLLRQAETENFNLTAQLHDAQRQLMMNEKLAVMGQLTARFAHEIGTPLNAIGGHLQLLKEELPEGGAEGVKERLEIVNGQLTKIEYIVKGFLQSTAKPTSQKQLVDLNLLVEKTLAIVTPRIELLGVEVRKKFDREMGPLRLVPMDLEQILLNLLNNSVDSVKSKMKNKGKGTFQVELKTAVVKDQGKVWAEISVFDTGEGIRRVDVKNVLKPFFTTKRPNEGTGLGLTISQELAHKYGGELLIDSKEGAWTRVLLRLPYHV